MVENLGNIDVSKNSENFYFWPVRTKGQFLQKSAFKKLEKIQKCHLWGDTIYLPHKLSPISIMLDLSA